MRVIEVDLPEREGQAARKIAVAFSHPWKKLNFRGGEWLVKTTSCTIGERRDRVTEDGKPCYVHYGFEFVKWPLAQQVDRNGKSMGPGYSVATLPTERLSRTNGAKAALKKVLALVKNRFTYDERTLIWKAFHRTMKTGVLREDGSSQPPVLATIPATVEQAAPQSQVLMMASPLYLPPDRWVWPFNSRVH